MVIDKTSCILIVAFILDCIIGDPQNPFHPIRIIGNGIYLGIKSYKKAKIKSSAVQFILGMLLTLIIIGLSYTVTRFITWGFYHLNFWLGLAAEAVLCYFLIAPKALKDESMKVCRALNAGDIEGARKWLSYIVGRDTETLAEPEIVKAAVETVAENLSDGVIAPLIFICIGGAPLGMAYKAVNTLDSMLGYRNEDFEYFGKFAARIDDVVNFIPARISAVLMILGSFFIGADVKGAGRIYKRDRYNHKSPNSAQTESVCAGALGLCLGGDSYYHGVLVSKPTIGDEIHKPEPKHIAASNRLMYAAAIIAVVLLAGVSMIIAVL
jgi:cobalamin biosynthesis protein CobD